jgi:uncharacterized protein (UPF0333 family)
MMKKLKKSLSVIFVVIMMAMVLASTIAVSQFVITERTNGTLRATTASWTNGQSHEVIAVVETRRADNTVIAYSDSPWQKISATTDWINSTGAARVIHTGFWR